MIYRCSSLTSHSSIATGLSWSWKWSQWWRHDVAWAFRSMDQITTLVPEAMLICLRNCKQKYFLSMKQTEVLRLLPERDLCPRRLLQSIYRQRIFNRPFYWYGGHIELLRFKEDYGGHEHDPFTHSVLTRALLGQFLFKFSWRKIVMGKKIVVPRLDVIMISFFPRNTRWSSLSECPLGIP